MESERNYNGLPRKSSTQFVSDYVSQLRHDIGYYLPYIPQSQADDLTAESFVEILEKDEQIWRCTNLLALKAAGDIVEIKSKDKSLKRLFDVVVEELNDFEHARVSLTEKSLILGLGIHKKEFSEIALPGFGYKKWLVPTGFREVDRRRLRIERDKDDKNILRWTIWSPSHDEYIILDSRRYYPGVVLGAAVEDFVWHWYRQEEEYPYGYGLGEVLFRSAYIKNKLLQYYANLCEGWSEPFVAAHIDSSKGAINAALGEGHTDAGARVKNLIEVLEVLKSRHKAVFDKADDIQFHEHGVSGVNLIQSYIDYLDRRQQLIIHGSELATDAAATGSYGQGSLHSQQTVAIAKYHRCRLSNCLKRDVFQDFLVRNYYNVVSSLGYFPTKHDYSVSLKVEGEEMKKEAMQQNIKDYRGNLENMMAEA